MMLAPNTDTPPVTYQCESFARWYADAGPLIKREAETTGIAPLRPNLRDYVKREETSGLIVLTARVRGELAGYLLYNLFIHPHYTLLAAEPDLFFVASEHASMFIGKGLLAFAESFMRGCGVKIWCARVPHGARHGRLYERMGFKPTEMLYIKML